jgi:hydrogenase large subunit
MCFRNLPVEFDSGGVATLRGGIPDPYSVVVSKPDVGVWRPTATSRISTWTRSPG